MHLLSTLSLSSLIARGFALSIAPGYLESRALSGTAHVYLGERQGPSQHYASGFIYGIPDTPNQIPDQFYDEIDFQYTRAGGAQTPEAQGWIGGPEEFKFRWESALSNYRTARQHGGQFILLVHDLWGADSLQPADAPFPGDNGDWAFYDEFFSALVQNMKQADMVEGVVIDIWNEPDGANFWNRPQDQYLQMWGRASEKFRSEFPDIPLSGPSASYAPYPTDTWWDAWASYVVSNQSLPDQHHWHSLRKTETSDQMLRDYDALLAKYGATRGEGLVNINEYGNPEEQTAAGSAWWIAQLERANIFGCRANWASAYALHDFMGQLLGKPGAGTDSYDPTGTGYWANAEYQVYKYYASTMTGDRVRTETTEDTNGDVYVTVDDDGMIRILAGARAVTGSWNVHLEGLSELGLPSSGALEVHAYKFPGTSDPYARVDAPTDLGVSEYNYTDDQLSLPLEDTDVYTAWAFEIEF